MTIRIRRQHLPVYREEAEREEEFARLNDSFDALHRRYIQENISDCTLIHKNVHRHVLNGAGAVVRSAKHPCEYGTDHSVLGYHGIKPSKVAGLMNAEAHGMCILLQPDCSSFVP